jgi:hypothetical protein
MTQDDKNFLKPSELPGDLKGSVQEVINTQATAVLIYSIDKLHSMGSFTDSVGTNAKLPILTITVCSRNQNRKAIAWQGTQAYRRHISLFPRGTVVVVVVIGHICLYPCGRCFASRSLNIAVFLPPL